MEHPARAARATDLATREAALLSEDAKWRSSGDIHPALKGTSFVRRCLRLMTKVVELMGNAPIHGANRARLGL